MTPWTPVSEQSETWVENNSNQRVFDPYVFDLAPVFDTGSVAGVWSEVSVQPEIWS